MAGDASLSVLRGEPVIPTLSALMEEWLSIKERLLCPKAFRNLRATVRHWSQVLGPLPPKSVGAREVQRLYASRDTGRLANLTLNSERHRLREFWRWLHQLDYVDSDPTGIWPLKNPRKRRRRYIHVDAVWEQRILERLKERFRRFMVFALTTGLRYGEIRSLLWGWISDDLVLVIPAEARKQGEHHRLALPRRALEALGLRGAVHQKVFHDLPAHNNAGKALKRAARKAGYPEWKHISPHQLRRSWLGRLSRAGVPREALKDLGGWRRESVMVEFYWSRIGDAETRGYLERI